MKHIGRSNFETELVFWLMMSGLPMAPSFRSTNLCFSRHIFNCSNGGGKKRFRRAGRLKRARRP